MLYIIFNIIINKIFIILNNSNINFNKFNILHLLYIRIENVKINLTVNF